MRAAVLSALGEVPRPDSFADPVPGPGQLLVGVLAGGLNPVDLAIASGRFYGPAPQVPYVVGREGVGRTADGRRVAFGHCIPPFGSVAEHTLVDEHAVVEVPDAVSDELAAALWTAGLAALVPFQRIAALRGGERVLVLGASGAVGQLAVQIARLLGAGRVVGAARNGDRLARAQELGADATVQIAPNVDLGRALGDASEGGFDVVLDLLWGEPAVSALQALVPWGRLVQVGSAAATDVVLPAAALRRHNITIHGYQSGLLTHDERMSAYRKLFGYAAAGSLVLDCERVALEDIGDAWARQAAGPHTKLIIVP